jgi:transmembrane sensor
MKVRVESRWNEAREAAAARAIGVRVRRQRIVRRVAVGTVAVSAIASAFGAALLLDRPQLEARKASPVIEPLVEAQEPERDHRMEFSDGSFAELDEARIDLEIDSEARIATHLTRGGARFEVVRNEARSFEVRTPHATVSVVGTVFSVRIDEANARTRVDVTRGHVVVASGAPDRHLRDGEGAWFTAAREIAVREAARAPDPPRERSWVALAREERFEDAYDALRATGGNARGADELWLAADSARRSGHAAEAVPYLERLVQEHAADGRAPLAAFTLGRVELQLGRASQAADAFARARSMAPAGSLAQDALAREALSRQRAGQGDRARTLAHEYLERYPNGRRAQEIRAILP